MNHLNAKAAENAAEPSLGFIIKERDGECFTYLLDASKTLPQRSMAFLKREHIDCLVIDCTYEHSDLSTGHFDVEGVIRIKKELNPRRTIISHVSHKNLSFDELTKRFAVYNIEVGYDGMVIEL